MIIFKISNFYNFYYYTIKNINRQSYALTCMKLLFWTKPEAQHAKRITPLLLLSTTQLGQSPMICRPRSTDRSPANRNARHQNDEHLLFTRIFSHFPTFIDMTPINGLGPTLETIYTLLNLRSKVYILTLWKHLLHTHSNLSVRAPADIQSLSDSPEQSEA
jgi:hypothetical protein